MENTDLSPGANEAARFCELLARAYIDELAQAEGATLKALSRWPTGEDAVDALLAELEEGEDDDAPRLRAATIALAVMTAYAIAGEPGLAGRLRCEDPIVTLAVHNGDAVAGVKSIISDVASGRRHDMFIVARDG